MYTVVISGKAYLMKKGSQKRLPFYLSCMYANVLEPAANKGFVYFSFGSFASCCHFEAVQKCSNDG